MRTVLLTGAEGLIGTIVRERLGTALRFRSLTWREEPFSDVVGDIADPQVARRAVVGVDAIVHLAGAAGVDASWESVLASNIVGTRNVLEAAREAGVRQVVLASSNHVVGQFEADQAPGIYDTGLRPGLAVEIPDRPDSLYGVSKAFGESLGRYYSERFGMHVIALRIGSVRPDDDPSGESSQPIEPWASMGPLTRRRRQAAVWLSHRDCAGLIAAALAATDVAWAVVYGVSANAARFWDLEPARTLLGWSPVDGAPVPADAGGVESRATLDA